MQSCTVTLGEREYVISECPIRQNMAWRKQLAEPINEIMAVVDKLKDLEISRVGDILSLVQGLRPLLTERLDDVSDWVISYSQNLQKDREYILDHAYESQLITALVEVLKLAFPFVSLLPGQNRLGLTSNPTLTNSQEANGASGLTS